MVNEIMETIEDSKTKTIIGIRITIREVLETQIDLGTTEIRIAIEKRRKLE